MYLIDTYAKALLHKALLHYAPPSFVQGHACACMMLIMIYNESISKTCWCSFSRRTDHKLAVVITTCTTRFFYCVLLIYIIYNSKLCKTKRAIDHLQESNMKFLVVCILCAVLFVAKSHSSDPLHDQGENIQTLDQRHTQVLTHKFFGALPVS